MAPQLGVEVRHPGADVAAAYGSQHAFDQQPRYTGNIIPIRYLDAICEKLHEPTQLGNHESKSERVRACVTA